MSKCFFARDNVCCDFADRLAVDAVFQRTRKRLTRKLQENPVPSGLIRVLGEIRWRDSQLRTDHNLHKASNRTAAQTALDRCLVTVQALLK